MTKVERKALAERLNARVKRLREIRDVVDSLEQDGTALSE